MKILIIILLTSLSASAQSFYHKKMKKANVEVKNCEAMKPRHTFVQKFSQKVLYTHKRKKAKRAKI